VSAPETRQQILDAAQRLLVTGGFARLTTREIAREAGFAEGTLFKHFKRKEDLYLSVVLENSPKFRQRIARMQVGVSTVAKNLERVAVAALDFFEKLIPLSVSLFADAELLARHRQQMQRHGRGPADVFDLIAGYIEGEQRLGRIGNQVDPRSAAALLLGPCFHRVFIRQVMGRDVSESIDKVFVAALLKTLTLGLVQAIPSKTRRKLQARRKKPRTTADRRR
jgi:AcrR family transcriptional regulator